jgi:hypothetical protein
LAALLYKIHTILNRKHLNKNGKHGELLRISLKVLIFKMKIGRPDKIFKNLPNHMLFLVEWGLSFSLIIRYIRIMCIYSQVKDKSLSVSFVLEVCKIRQKCHQQIHLLHPKFI